MGSIIISRVLFLALLSSCSSALAPLSAAEDDNDCALYLTGPGRSSAYDYTLNLLKGNFGYEGQHTCITYDAVNQAYLEARNRIAVSQPKGDWKAEDFASVGELILDISINLAKRYGLTYEEIEKGLPLIDTSRTLIRDVCPPVFSHVECRAGKYRRLDGLCNNLEHPTWGSTMSPFQRLIGPLFADGINAPRISHTGHDLPLSRVVSRTMHPDDGYHDHAGTVMVIAWGQFMDHDYTLTGTPLDPINRNDPEECCSRPQHLKHPYCNEIRVPDDDYFYRLWGVKCIDFVRAFPSPRPGCRLGSRVPFNTLTGAIDGNTVYGVTEKFSRKLRTGYGGLLRMNPVFKEYGLKDLLPLKLDIPDEGCTRPNKNMYCFEGGEIRVNEQLVLTVMHTLMAREHNRVAKGLASVNPHWDDEILFQEARRINVAEIQHITYNEFLPILLGKDVMEKFGLVLEKEGYWDGYDPNVNPDVIDAFASAAFRFGHSLLPTAVERWSKAHKFIASKRLSDLIRRPYDLYRAGVLDEYVMGLMNQVAQAMDDSITQEVTNHLFKKIGARFGMDLVSFNMQRGREFGIPGYMEFRKFCGLNGADTFQDLFGSMPNETVRKYETIFEHPIDVDLWSGGVSERPLPGSMLGPTFACVIATQFSYSRRGDRFWFELPNQPSSFTPEQLAELRKARLARVICDNTDIIDTVQLYPMVLPDHELNPRVPCRSGILPSIDFSKWAEPAPFHHPHPHPAPAAFVTEAFIPNKNSTENETGTENMEETIVILENGANNKTVEHNEQRPNCQNGSNCAESTDNCLECAKHPKKSHGPDTIRKYVYKNDEKETANQKPSSHPKNSLKRKKRSTSAPLIVNYETSHEPAPFARQTAGVIRNVDLADFNIETLHDAHPVKIKEEGQSKVLLDVSNSKSEEDSASHERGDRSEARNDDDDSSESEERRQTSKQRQNSDESHEDERKSKPFKESDNSNERSYERNEDYTNRRRDKEHDDRSDESSPHDSVESNENTQRSPYEKRQHSEERNVSRERSDRSHEDDSREKTSDGSYEKTDDKTPYRDSKNKSDYRNEENDSQSVEQDNRHNNRENDFLPYSKAPFSAKAKDSNENPEQTFDDSTSSERVSPIIHTNQKNDFSNPRDDNSESNESGALDEKEKYSEKKPQLHEKNNFKHASEPLLRPKNPTESNEQDAAIAALKRKNFPERKDEYINSSPVVIKDVDLGDFSYETIHVNNRGVVEPLRDAPETYDNLPLAAPITTHQTETVDDDQERPIKSSNIQAPFNDDSSPHIDNVRVEVKPVVEINPEQDDSSKEALKAEPNDDTSLETLLGVKSFDSEEKSDKNVAPKEPEDTDNVKQQFERIPKNYNHDKKEKEHSHKEQNVTPVMNIPQTQNYDDEKNNQGTLDELKPIQYDEHLNYKFDDISIKLPEIKFPEDILSIPYDYKTSPYKEKKKQPKKQKFYRYDESDYNEDNPHGHNDDEEHKNIHHHDDHADHDDHKNHDDDEHDHGYHNYYGRNKKKQDYKKKHRHHNSDDDEGDEEEEDLYEKFVRERFGKRGSFEKRSENLEDPRPAIANEQLFDSLQKVIKKAKSIEEEAQKSGDPKAGYAWTLEYGQKL